MDAADSIKQPGKMQTFVTVPLVLLKWLVLDERPQLVERGAQGVTVNTFKAASACVKSHRPLSSAGGAAAVLVVRRPHEHRVRAVFDQFESGQHLLSARCRLLVDLPLRCHDHSSNGTKWRCSNDRP